jgi:hypothetical protein
MIAGNRLLFFAIPFGVVFVSWFLMRTLLLPRVGCWLFYFSTLTALFCILVLGLALVGTAALIQHIFNESGQKDLETYVVGGAALVLMFVGKLFLKARNKRPFPTIMRWFIVHSFQDRVGRTLPTGVPVNDSRRLSFRAVFDDNYGDELRYGSVEGWGVKACCKRLLAIKNR